MIGSGKTGNTWIGSRSAGRRNLIATANMMTVFSTVIGAINVSLWKLPWSMNESRYLYGIRFTHRQRLPLFNWCLGERKMILPLSCVSGWLLMEWFSSLLRLLAVASAAAAAVAAYILLNPYHLLTSSSPQTFFLFPILKHVRILRVSSIYLRVW